MPWVLFGVPFARRTDLDTVLHDDLVSRQSQKVRDAATLGGPAGEMFVLIDGSAEAVRRAEELLQGIGRKLTGTDAESLLAKLREEDEAASAGMGLFFTE